MSTTTNSQKVIGALPSNLPNFWPIRTHKVREYLKKSEGEEYKREKGKNQEMENKDNESEVQRSIEILDSDLLILYV